ncbi:MAG: inorganic phosphate transporter [Anaerolineales bacterium]|nr:inorganic phosphate transporter [Anaerolineales bacterium]
MSPLVLIVIALIVWFTFLNGVADSSNIVATMISSRAMSPRMALGVTAFAEFIAPFIFGVSVANTIGNGIVETANLKIEVIFCALLSALIWSLFTWRFGIPSSSSHALIGGIIGAVIMAVGFQAIKPDGLLKVIIGLFTSPLIGLFAGFIVMKIVLYYASFASVRINQFFKNAQFITALTLAFSYGTNDAQKTMGIMMLTLTILGYINNFQVPLWVIAINSTLISLGTILGGWRLIRTLGAKFYRIRPIHAFSTQLTAASVILVNSIFGAPVSTTQVVSSAIMGIGSAERVNKVRWEVAKEIVMAWIFTIPSTSVVSAFLYWLIKIFNF